MCLSGTQTFDRSHLFLYKTTFSTHSTLMLFAFCCWTWEADSLLVKIFCVYNCCEMHQQCLFCPVCCAFIFFVQQCLFCLPLCIYFSVSNDVFSVWSTTMLFKDLCQYFLSDLPPCFLKICVNSVFFCLIYHHAF